MKPGQEKTMGGWSHFVSLLRYALPYRRAVILQLILMAVSVSFSLLKPWPLKVLVDHVAVDEPLALAGWTIGLSWQALLFAACLAYLIFHAGESLVQVFSQWTATLTSSRMIRDLRSDLLHKLQMLSLRFHDNSRVGDMVHRVTYNSSAVETAFQSGFMGVLKSVVMLVGMFTIMMLMNPLLTIVALAVVPFLLILIRMYAHKTHRVSLQHQTQEGRVSSQLQELLSGIRLVKACNQEGAEHLRFTETCTQSIGTRLRSTMVQNSFGFFTALILAAGTGLLFWVGMHEVRQGNLTIGEFLVFLAYLGMLYAPLSILSYTASSIQGALGGASRLFEILESDDEIPEPIEPQPLAGFEDKITFAGVGFAYTDDHRVLHDVSLEVHRGETVAIVGETGSGKSTLLSLLIRFYDPNDGAVSLDDIDLRQLSSSTIRSLIAFAPQDTLLLSGTIADNIAYGRPDATQAEIEEAARSASAHDFIMACENGYQSIVGERGVRLSAGQRQRISLARAFLRNTPIMLLDEPTSALDAETEAAIMGRLSEMTDKTVLLVAHRLSTIRFADKIVVLKNGRVMETGTHEQLLEAGSDYSRLWNAQLSGYEGVAL